MYNEAKFYQYLAWFMKKFDGQKNGSKYIEKSWDLGQNV